MKLKPKEMPEHVGELIRSQADFIISQQLPSGAIPWSRGDITDPWDHVESAIALDLAGRFNEAISAYRWMQTTQNPDGSWYSSYLDSKAQDLTRDTNFSSYIATGMWFHYLITRDLNLLDCMWPTVEKAINFALSLQQPSGEIYWGVNQNNQVWPGAILTAASSIWLSIRCGTKIAHKLGQDKPDWDDASKRLARAIREHPELFDRLGEDKTGHSMTWYYPILTGLVKGQKAEERILERWQEFVIDGWGCKCHADRETVCVAETCELLLTLTRMGARDKAKMVFNWILRFRDNDGVFYREIGLPGQQSQPKEKVTWASAAAILAIVALAKSKLV